MNTGLRSAELTEAYKEHKASGVMEQSCVLCDAPAVETFTHWKIINNDFPYDLIAKTHHMIVPLRHKQEKELTSEELSEYQEIKADRLPEYDVIIEATNRTKSIPEHFHLHLVIVRDGIR